MESTTLPHPRVVARLVLAAALLVALAVVTFTGRGPLYRSVAGGTEALAFDALVTAVASKGLLALVAAVAVVAVHALRRGRTAVLRLAVSGVGVVAAYASSEVIKLLVTQERPCRAYAIETVLACPPPGDWSWPSNHSTIAAALATACILVIPRAAWFVVPAALVIAGSRVAAGVHYPHDVLSGLALGILVTGVIGLVLSPLAVRAVGERPRARARA